VPINSVQVYIQQLINGLIMPGTAGNLVAYITPPDPNEETDLPTAYIWPDTGDESRNNAKGGTVPRNPGFSSTTTTLNELMSQSGYKAFEHHMLVYMIWNGQDDDPAADTWFPGMVDAVMFTLRTSPNTAQAQDPYTGQYTTLVDVGENMTYRITLRALADQRYNRYDALITLELLELMRF
jgi:hypothetical protein